ncbi:hypothetical protein GRI40_01750 [Altererythrobacter aerius]|uniref:Uncharacterized protein n=1 Tax=Tsuneonella aeria TaxID=1837929 RepID=A0A6I4TB94_9SPHN|nr:hypothetical protein [Tsuneonella aeria]MXO73947.1 hypothetical protein [Tsuneonella aeria]
MASAAGASAAVDIDRAVFIERQVEGVRALEPATTLRKGDKVVLMVAWTAAPSAKGYVVESAVPRPLAFQRAGSDAAEVSIDGGRTWGQLGELRLGNRLASAEDVTHLRMRVPASATSGRLTYKAIVR